MKTRLDLLWEEFHLPIWATEFDWNWQETADFGDHSYHAEVLDNFYRLMFSHQVSVIIHQSALSTQQLPINKYVMT